ncbi:hypothetical protein [Effusibacillus dendaii]|uniref:Uncharacterized protein n=1 Tax=Effusibacillus dendaii TaxID=2743772 RepID=A0A7I8D991_9BACL|nr:hypothetical protein [Effusibacillus dendaii]BCJ86684.1 hypothetical protein skT53_16690 [Effusibacillus dendaii]
MPALFTFGFFKNDQLTQGSSVGFGQNVFQNRNSTKQNNGSITIGDGVNWIGFGMNLNGDQDAQDMTTFDAQDFAGPQV